MKRIDLNFQHPKKNWNDFLGHKLREDSYDVLVEENADVYTPEGDLLFKFRKKSLSATEAQKAFPILLEIKEVSKNRGVANGKLYIDKYAGKYQKKDGSKSNYHFLKDDGGLGSSSIIGFYDRYVRYPYCRETAFNARETEKWKKLIPFLQSCSQVYETAAQDRWIVQKSFCDKTHPAWVIKDTVFTTVTVNQNWSTAVHTDVGDLKEGLSCITALRSGEYKGCNLVFPHYRAAVNLDTCDLLMFNSHHMHGNTPLIGKIGAYKRVSLVLYYREKMQKCLSPEGELNLAKNRKPGDPLWPE